MRLLYNYHILARPSSYELDTSYLISTPVVRSRPPLFLKWAQKWPYWTSFLPISSVWPQIDHALLIFHFSIYLLPSLRTSFVVQHMVLQFVRTLSTLLHCHCLFHLVVQRASHNIYFYKFLQIPFCNTTRVRTSSFTSITPTDWWWGKGSSDLQRRSWKTSLTVQNSNCEN